jgi:hypothetical protein
MASLTLSVKDICLVLLYNLALLSKLACSGKLFLAEPGEPIRLSGAGNVSERPVHVLTAEKSCTLCQYEALANI